jgi:hypothetical protein
MLLLNGGASGGEALASRCCHVLVLICCGSLEMVLVCLGAVKPFVYAGGTRVPWRRLAVRSLRPPPDADGVAVLGGLDYALLLCRLAVRGLSTTPPMQVVSWRRVVLFAHFR